MPSQEHRMKRWRPYLKSKASTSLWGAVALDYYNAFLQSGRKRTPCEHIDLVLRDLLPHATNIMLFHRVFLALSVRLLPNDFESIIQRSLLILDKKKLRQNTAVVAALTEDYGRYGAAKVFTQALKLACEGDESMPQPTYSLEGDLRICHISDLHFGGQHDPVRFAGVGEEFSRTAYFMNFLHRAKQEDRQVDLLVVSGDITSVAAPDEFDEFVAFLEEVEATGIVRNAPFWPHVVLVPGNHEVRRGPGNGGGDRLAAFGTFVARLNQDGRVLSTPYSARGEGMCVSSGHSDDGAPFALHEYPGLGLHVLTLTSCFYSQGLNPEVLPLIDTYERLKAQIRQGGSSAPPARDIVKEYFEKRVHLDVAFFDPQYPTTVARAVAESDKTRGDLSHYVRVAVCHHHLTKYFDISGIPDPPHGKQLARDLAQAGFTRYLHGHIHCRPKASRRKPMEVSAPALSGMAFESRNGFNILTWHRSDGQPKAKPIARYELSEGAGEYLRM